LQLNCWHCLDNEFWAKKITNIVIKITKVGIKKLNNLLLVKFIISLCLVFCAFNSAVAQNQGVLTKDSPTRIRSDIIDIKRKSQLVTFINNVVVEKDDSSLLANKMKVLYDKQQDPNNKDKSSNSIKRIEAYGDVKIFSEEFIASGDKGHYNPIADLFILENNVIVNNGTSIASGNKFIYSLKTKKGKFVGQKNETSITGNGGDKRVVVIIGNDANDSSDNKNDDAKDKK